VTNQTTPNQEQETQENDFVYVLEIPITNLAKIQDNSGVIRLVFNEQEAAEIVEALTREYSQEEQEELEQELDALEAEIMQAPLIVPKTNLIVPENAKR